MTQLLQTALILLVLLQVKHLLADFFMQTPRMLAGRGTYLHLGRLQHAGLHAVFSAFALIAVGTPISVMIWIAVLDGLVHFHIDFAKGRYSEKVAHGPGDAAYWWAFGADQALHQLTYIAIIAAWATYGQ